MTTGGAVWVVFRAWFNEALRSHTLLIVAKSETAAARIAKNLGESFPVVAQFVGLESLGPVDAWEGPPPGSRLEQRAPEGPRVIT